MKTTTRKKRNERNSLRTSRNDLARYVSPVQDYAVPVQRWFLYPHSFSKSLVEVVLDELVLKPSDLVCDPFVGAGSTLVACGERGLSGHGIDVLPLSPWVTNVKMGRYDIRELRKAVTLLFKKLSKPRSPRRSNKRRGLHRYLGAKTVAEIDVIRGAIRPLAAELRPFFELALVRELFALSRVKRDGGWFRWKDLYRDRPDLVFQRFFQSVGMMLADVESKEWPRGCDLFATSGDARMSPLPGQGYRLIMGSPPYLNRHDYTRILAVELLALFAESMDDLKPIRYSTMRSHVEAHTPERDVDCFSYSPRLCQVIKSLDDHEVEARIRRMVTGYFSDLALVFANVSSFIDRGAYICLVLSDARFSGVVIPVRDIANEIARNIGLSMSWEWIVRWRGNSSQQMGTFGRLPVAESVITWQKK